MSKVLTTIIVFHKTKPHASIVFLLQLPRMQMLVIKSSKTIPHLYYYIFYLNPFNYSKTIFFWLSTCTNSMLLKIESTWSN